MCFKEKRLYICTWTRRSMFPGVPASDRVRMRRIAQGWVSWGADKYLGLNL